MAAISKMNRRKKTSRFLTGAAVVVLALILVGSSMLMRKFFETETYYTLKQDIPAHTQITPNMLEPKQAPTGSIPFENLVTLAKVQSDDPKDAVFSSVALKAGDMVLKSVVTTGSEDLKKQIPEGWVITNFSVSADNAVGGRIKNGSYFDILVATSDGAFYPFLNMKALDTTVDLSNASSSDAVDTEEAHAGQTTQYTVGLTPENASKLQSIMSQYNGNVKLVLSNGVSDPATHQPTGSFAGNAPAPLSVSPDTDNGGQAPASQQQEKPSASGNQDQRAENK